MKKNTALLLVDLQKGFEDVTYWGGNRNNLNAEANAQRILAHWRAAEMPVFHVQHCSTTLQSPLAPGKPGHALLDATAPQEGELLFQKNVNSAFIGTNLQKALEERGIDSLVIMGLTTDHCISTTTRMAANLGFETYLISDATAAFDRVGVNGEKYDAELIHLTTLASLREEFATILTTAEIFKKVEKLHSANANG